MYNTLSLPEIAFPDGFLWGSSTAAHQIEGDNFHNNWWAKETRGETEEKSGKACDHWNRMDEDADLIAELGHQAYRMSIEWSRIEPLKGEWNQAALDRYIHFLSLLKERGIQVFLTLHHVTHPQWFEKLGAFYELENCHLFEEFVDKVVPQISDYVDGWNVFNEFNLATSPNSGRRKFNMLITHGNCNRIIKQYSKAPVSTTHAFVHQHPARLNDPLDNTMRDYVDFMTNEFFFHAVRTGELVYPYMDAEYHPKVKNSVDFWAVNTYTRSMIDSRKKNFQGERFIHKQLKMIDMDFYLEEFYPEGIIANLERLKDKPVYITENGCSCDDDKYRIEYIALHLCALKEAMDRGVDLKGYFYWSTMDNYEWGSFKPRFGLVDVDRKTFERTPKPSAYFYRKIIENNGFFPETLKKYLKES